MKKTRLSLLLPQNKENCLDVLKEAQRKEKPAAYLDFLFGRRAQKLEALAFEQIIVREAQLISSRYVNCAHDHLKNVVSAEQRRDVDCFAL